MNTVIQHRCEGSRTSTHVLDADPGLSNSAAELRDPRPGFPNFPVCSDFQSGRRHRLTQKLLGWPGNPAFGRSSGEMFNTATGGSGRVWGSSLQTFVSGKYQRVNIWGSVDHRQLLSHILCDDLFYSHVKPLLGFPAAPGLSRGLLLPTPPPLDRKVQVGASSHCERTPPPPPVTLQGNGVVKLRFRPALHSEV